MQVAILRAVGDGGLQDPAVGNYISSKRDTIAPFTPWAESLANHGQLKVIEVLKGSEWSEFINHVAKAQGDEAAALDEYRKVLPNEDNGVERMRVVENAADLDRQREQESEREGRTEGRRGRPRNGETSVVKNDATEVKPAE